MPWHTPTRLYSALYQQPMWPRAILVVVTVFWIASLAIRRAVVFVHAWRDAERLHQDESWLRAQCGNATFYANMRMHTDVCETVRRNAERSPVVAALEAVVKGGDALDPLALWPLLFVPIAVHILSWCVSKIGRRQLIPI